MNTPQNNSEEVDLLALFSLFGRAFTRVFNFIGSIFNAIFAFFIFILKAIIENFILIAIVVVIAGIIGYYLEKNNPPKYTSDLIVRTFFDGKYQLNTNIGYYNALISEENYEAITSIFEIDLETAKQIKKFEIFPGPETENEKIVQYDQFIKSIDSVRAQELSFEDYINNRSIYAGNVYLITAHSKKRDIFQELETGLTKSFTNPYSIAKKKKRDSLNHIARKNTIANIKQVDSLRKIYVEVLLEQSKSTNQNISFSGAIPLQQEKIQTKEYDLLNKEIELTEKLRKLEAEIISENEYFEIISGFQAIGNHYSPLSEKYSMIFPGLGFLFLCAIYSIKKTVIYVKNYEV